MALLGAGVVTNKIPQFKIFGIFKVIRIFRLSALVTRANVHQDTKSLMNVMKVTFYLCLWLHLNACCFYYVAQQNKGQYDEDGRLLTWLSPTDFYDLNNQWAKEETSFIVKYLIFYYYAIL